MRVGKPTSTDCLFIHLTFQCAAEKQRAAQQQQAKEAAGAPAANCQTVRLLRAQKQKRSGNRKGSGSGTGNGTSNVVLAAASGGACARQTLRSPDLRCKVQLESAQLVASKLESQAGASEGRPEFRCRTRRRISERGEAGGWLGELLLRSSTLIFGGRVSALNSWGTENS